MLKIPSWRTFPEHRVTAYQDDSMFWKFYLVPEYLTIRKDEEGKPVFLLVSYAFSDQDRAENPDLPRGGGFIAMDVELRVDPADQEAIVTQLQKDVDDLWNQLKSLADAAHADVRGYRITSSHHLRSIGSTVTLGVDDVLLGLGRDAPEAPPGDVPPKVILADPTWTEGTFRVSAPQSANLVSNRVAEGPLSLVGTNVASANLDLTSAGADFMVQALVGPSGTGVTDLTPIQVVYQMKFWARVPPVSVYASADSRSLYESVKSIMHDYEGGGCDEDVLSHSEQYLQMAISSGLVTVQVDKADPDTPDDVVTQMRGDAVKTMQQMLTDRFFDKKPAPPEDPDDPTKDFTTRQGDVYYLKSEASVDFAHFEYREAMSSVRKWPINPQGTLQAFLHGLSSDEVQRYVRKIDLADTFFQTLGLRAAVFGVDWANDPIDDVEVEFQYTGTDENGQQVQKATSAVFTKTATAFTWDPSLIGAKREYSYRWRVGYRGHGPSDWSAWTASSTNMLTIGVTAPGKVAATFVAGNIDFAAATKSVQVEVRYSDPASGVAEDGTTLRLDTASGTQGYSRWIYLPQRRPLRYRTHFFLKNDQTIDSDWIETTDDQVMLNEPRAENRLDVLLIPVGDWSHVVQSVVALRYADAAHAIRAEGTYQLHSAEEFKTWAVFVADAASPRSFEYKMLTSFKDGGVDETAWLTATGDQPLTVAVKQRPVLAVSVIPALVDFAVTPVVEVHLDYADPGHGIRQTETFALTGKDTQTWRVDLADPARTDFQVTTTYNTADGQQIVVGPVVSTDNKYVVPRHLAPEVACLMIPRLLDFTATPVVQVDVRYADPAHGVADTQSFTFTDAAEQHYRLPTAEGAPTSFDVTVTYFLANGSIVQRAPVTLTASKIVIPRYVPS